MNDTLGREATSQALSASPPVAVAAGVLGGFTLNDVVLGVTLVYLVLQIGYLAWKWLRDVKRARLALPPVTEEAS